LIKGKNTALSKRAATICYYTQGFCQLAHNNHPDAYVKFAKVKSILDENPHIRKDLSKRYIRTLDNIINCLIDSKDYNQAKDVIHEMNQMKSAGGFNSIDVQVSIFRNTHLAELKIHHESGDFDKGLELVETILKGMEKYEGKMHKEQELTFFYHIAYIYFGAGKFNKSLFWINKVLNDNENTLRQDIYSYARLFNLVIHYELGNHDLLEYITKSTQRYLSKRQRAYMMEKLVIDTFRKLIRTNNIIDRKDHLAVFRGQLLDMMDSQENRVVLKYFDFLKWTDSKIENASFAETIKKAI
ncbi:MAG: hypothetical protein AAF193_07490, partial [Bacteroidota bacterium]